MRVLLTGGSGFIGSHVCELLLLNDHEVVLLDDMRTGLSENIPIGHPKLSTFNEDLLQVDLRLLPAVDVCIHLAAQVSVQASIEDFYESSSNNILGSIRIIDFCSKARIPLVYASSAAVYGGSAFGDDESGDVSLLTPYAADKYAMEKYASVAATVYDLPSLGLRFFNVYGPRQNAKSAYSGVISKFADALMKGNSLQIFGGGQTRDFVYVEDVAAIVCAAASKVCDGYIVDRVNVLSGRSVSVDDLAKIMMDGSGTVAPIQFLERKAGDPVESRGSVLKLQRLFPEQVSKFLSLEVGLEKTFSALKELKL